MQKNTIFNFKQFSINQDKCAMKICTDACIFGAFVEVENATSILDIGTGTGLLALMLAQRSNAKIEAVEIDESAYNQAIENIEKSIFKDKIKIFHTKIQDFIPLHGLEGYDLIISNPPFYQHSLHSPNKQTNKALHAVELTFEELLASVARLLKKNGKFVVLLPPFETESLCEIAKKNNFYIHHQLLIQHDETKPIFRIITTFSREINHSFEKKTLLIWEKYENLNNKLHYSIDFQLLLKDYYTIF